MDYKDDFLETVNNELAKIGIGANVNSSAGAVIADGPGMRNIHHRSYVEEEMLLPISFHNTMNGFQEGIGTKWSIHPDDLSNLKNVGSGDFVYGNGKKYRLALEEARIKNLYNSSQVPVGLKFSGLPVSAKCVDSKCRGVDIVIPPASNSAIDHVIYKSEWKPHEIAALISNGWGNLTKKSIDDSVINKGPAAWKLNHDSPIVSVMASNKVADGTNLQYIQGDANAVGYHLARAGEAEKYHNILHNELGYMPFTNPYQISATIHRMDTPQWSSTKIGETINHPGIIPTTPEYIGANLHLKYKLFPVDEIRPQNQ